MKKLIPELTYFFKWRIFRFLGFPEHSWIWFKRAYRVAKLDRHIYVIEEKYKWLFLHLDLDYNGYLSLKSLKEKEIAKIKSDYERTIH